jgi:hypothetical protein
MRRAGGVSKEDATPRNLRTIHEAAPPLCARQPRVSNFRVCHTSPQNRNWKEAEKRKVKVENGKLAGAVLARRE